MQKLTSGTDVVHHHERDAADLQGSQQELLTQEDGRFRDRYEGHQAHDADAHQELMQDEDQDEEELAVPVEQSPLERDGDDMEPLNADSMQTYMNEEHADTEQGGRVYSMLPDTNTRGEQLDFANMDQQRRAVRDTSKTNFARVSGMARTAQKKKTVVS